MKHYKRLFFLFFLSTLMGVSALAQKHQKLFFTPERISFLKKRIETDAEVRKNWEEALAVAKHQLEKPDLDKTDYLSLAYLMTGEQVYADIVKEQLLKLCTKSTWSNPEMLKRQPAWSSDLRTAGNCWIVTMGLEGVYDQLSKDDRKTIVSGLMRMGIRPALDEWFLPEKRIHTLNSMGHNWWSSCVYMAGVALLSVKEDVPESAQWLKDLSASAEEWFGFAGDQLQHKVKTWDAKGGMYESVNYASFGVSEYLLFRLAFQNVLPKVKQPDIPLLKNIPSFFMNVGYPRDGMMYSLTFGDSHKNIVGERPVKLLWALGYQDPNALWYLNNIETGQHREGLAKNAPMGLIFHPDFSKSPELPNLPTSQLYEDMDWATLRDSWKKNSTLLAVKSGHTWNHSHADVNSFLLFHKGEFVIKDAGHSWYASKEYPAYFFQSPAHNVLTFNGKYQPTEQQYHGAPLRGEMSELLDAGDIKYVMSNGTGPTSWIYSRNFRHFLWIGKVILVIDDVKAHETGKFEWLLHPAGESQKVRGDISIVNKKGAVLVRPLFPETLVETGFNHDFPEKMTLNEVLAPNEENVKEQEKYYSIGYPEQVRQTKFITAIILKDSINDTNIPVIERMTGEDMIGVKIKQDGKVTDVYLNLKADARLMHLNSIKTLGGYTTDAYLTAISYPEKAPNTISNYFIGYGSFLRKDSTSLFSSLSKLSLVVKEKDAKYDIQVTGQPLIRATFSASEKPINLSVNGQMQKVDFQKGNFSINLQK